MDRNITAIMPHLNELYKIYETYAWQNSNRKIMVIYNDLSITFFLYEENTLVDELVLVFPKEECDLYKAISLNLFITMLGNTKIHKLNPDMYHNPYHKPYLLVTCKDKELQSVLNNLVLIQEKEDLNQETNVIKEANKKVKRRKYDQEFINLLGRRVHLSDKMLGSWNK